MKKRFSVLFVVLVLMSIFTSTVFAAPAASKSVSLVSIQYQAGGIVLLFETSGLTNADLKDNSFYADSNDQKMSCNFVDDTTKVRCTVSKALAGEGGFHGTLAGFGFWGELPQPRSFDLVCAAGEIAWLTIDVFENGELVFSGEIPAWIWDEITSDGALDELAEMGIIFQVTGAFCAPDIEDFPL